MGPGARRIANRVMRHRFADLAAAVCSTGTSSAMPASSDMALRRNITFIAAATLPSAMTGTPMPQIRPS